MTMRSFGLFTRLFGRFNNRTFREHLNRHLRRWGISYVLVLLGAAWFQAHYAFGLNASASLSHRLFLIHKAELPKRHHYVAFRWSGGGPYPAGATFIKIIAGATGDLVTREEREFFVNGTWVGSAKARSRQGAQLELGPTGVIPPEHYYVRAPHPDSLDSRYELTGWISQAEIIGRAYALF